MAVIDAAVLERHGIKPDEYERILELMGREPNLLELGLYWRAQGQYWTTWARAAGGYASFSADRSLVATGVYLNNKSDWHGWTAAVAG